MKKIMTILTILVILISLHSCNNETLRGYSMVTTQMFSVVDKDGNDLLDLNKEGGIDQSNIKIFYIIKGEKIKFNIVQDDNKGFTISKSGESEINPYLIKVFLNTTPDKGDIAYTLIEWEENQVDTIKSKVSEGDNYLISNMISFNDSSWSPKEGNTIFTIVK